LENRGWNQAAQLRISDFVFICLYHLSLEQ